MQTVQTRLLTAQTLFTACEGVCGPEKNHKPVKTTGQLLPKKWRITTTEGSVEEVYGLD